ncbi:MAG: hypothetical protein AB201_01525 [Parcubacteria bacterium C7867-006]|nr:MAG: hypothetical protein AB201_01525 [Parcubacteria bacterium C7867-006]
MITENNKAFKDIPLKIYEPEFGSELTNIIIELEKLRVKKLGGPVPPHIFFQLKEIFQMFESLGSARIEGNRTTLSEFVEKIIENPTKKTKDDGLKEIYNIDNAIQFIEKNVDSKTNFSRYFISEIHKILVDGLTPPPTGEGSRYPGQFRPVNVTINKSSLISPEHVQVPEYMEELLGFVNQPRTSQYHLLVMALAHHRMAWIHPFDNGNGRMVRMFTYALLIKQGFKVKSGRIINPTAIFCMDRNKYYEKLAHADSGTREGVLEWCTYVLEGLRSEIEKIDNLLDLKYMTNTILIPALDFALERENITRREYEILVFIVKNKGMEIRPIDLKKAIGKDSVVERSRILKKLRDKKMVEPIGKQNGRIYTISFANNYLLRGIAHVLEKNGFVPESLNKKD